MALSRINRKAGTRGMALIELVVLLGAITIISLVGMRLIHLGLQRMSTVVSSRREEQGLDDLYLRLQMAWDQRLEPWMAGETWLSITAVGTGEAYTLQGLRIRTAGPAGGIQIAELVRGEADWRIIVRPTGGLPGESLTRPVDYAGDILIDVAGGEFRRGEGPDQIHFRFPDAGNRHLRQGFAIRSYW